MSQRLSLVQVLPKPVQEHVRAGRIPAQAAMKYLVPLARAKRDDCEVLSEAIAKHHLSRQQERKEAASLKATADAVKKPDGGPRPS